MLEVIYDKNKEEKVIAVTEEGNNEAVDFKLPKNIRQIGTPSGRRIYIEDYVITYLNYIARPGSTQARGAILLGESKKTEVGEVLFICGAVDAQNVEFDMDESEFTQDVWTDIYSQVKEHFPSLSVVGWFLSRMGFSTAINDKIEKMHVDNFPGRDKVLYITDSLESDDAFYVFEHGQMIKQKGYYIYYSKNEAMQNYIIKQKGGISDDDNTEIQRKDEEIVKNYRQKNERIQGNKSEGISLMYVASSFVVLAMLAMGITVIGNYDRMKDMEVSINRLELTAEETGESIVETMNSEPGFVASQSSIDESSVSETIIVDTTQTQTVEQGDDTEVSTSVVIEENVVTTEAQEQEANISTEQNLPVMSGGNPIYYEIKYGDTLSSIAQENYGSVIYAGDIAKANNMEIDDKIYQGEEIILPSLEPRD